MPVKTSNGKERKLPPPAIEFSAPATRAAPNNNALCKELTNQCSGKLLPFRGRRGSLAVTRLQDDDCQHLNQRSCIGDNDGGRAKKYAVDQPKTDPGGKGHEHTHG